MQVCDLQNLHTSYRSILLPRIQQGHLHGNVSEIHTSPKRSHDPFKSSHDQKESSILHENRMSSGSWSTEGHHAK